MLREENQNLYAQIFVPVRFKTGTYYGHNRQKSDIVSSDLNDGKVIEATLLLSYIIHTI